MKGVLSLQIIKTKKILAIKEEAEKKISNEIKKVQNSLIDFTDSLIEEIKKNEKVANDFLQFLNKNKLENVNKKYTKLMEIYE